MGKLVEYSLVQDHVAIIRLQRPEAANALSNALLDDLNRIIQQADANPKIRCTIITGAGEKAFCAGADLKERRGMNDSEVVAAVRYIGKTVSAIERMRMPVIAALNGVAFGGGLELALACDIRVAIADTKVGLTETSLAIIPGAGGTQRLARLIGPGQAKKLIFTAKPITAEAAHHIGLIEDLTNSEGLMERAIQLATTIAHNGPIALEQAKLSINQGLQTDLATGLELEHTYYQKTIPTADRMEGLEAFKEKRRPIYYGK